MALTPAQQKLANQAKGKKHQYRSPAEQAALEAARVAGVQGFRAPGGPAGTVGGAPSSKFKLPGNMASPGGPRANRVQRGPGGQRTFVGPDGRRHPITPRGAYDKTGKPKTYTGAGGKKYKGYDKVGNTATGIYGKGGEAGWLKRWYKDLEAMGLPTMTPKEFSKWADWDPGSAAWDVPTLAEQKKMFHGAARKSITKYGDWAGSTVKDLDMSHVRSEEALKFFASRALGKDASSLESVKNELAPAAAYADHMYQRWLKSGGADIAALSGAGGEAAIPAEILPFYQVSKLRLANMMTPGSGPPDNNAMMALYRAAKNPKKGKELRAALTKVQASMPAWVPQAYETIKASPQAANFAGGGDHAWFNIWGRINQMSSESGVLGAPGGGVVNLWDPKQPFLPPGSPVMGQGAPYIASLSPYEYFTEAGLQMADWQNPNAAQNYPVYSDLTGAEAQAWKHPLEQLPTHKRFQAYGNLDPEAARKDWRNNFGYDPFATTGWGDWTNKVPTKSRGYSWDYAKALGVPYLTWLGGAQTPQEAQDSYWSTRAPYAPWALDPATLERMRRVQGWY